MKTNAEKFATLALFGLVMGLVGYIGLKQTGNVCENRFCVRQATKFYQDGPNTVQFPTHNFCDECYAEHIKERKQMYLHLDWENGSVIYGNQLFDKGRLQKSEVRSIDFDI
jgi:hypothetical protein